MWLFVTSLVLLGYFCLGRSFAYWGIPAWRVFIGEAVLALFLFFGPGSRRGNWPWVAMRVAKLRRYTRLLWLLLIFGIFQVVHGLLSGQPASRVLRDLALHYYPFYFFLGIMVGCQDRDFLSKFFRRAAWANAFYGILFIVWLSRVSWFFPGVPGDVQPVSIFGQPSFSAAILLGLISFEKDLSRNWLLLTLNSMVLVGMLIRAEWLAFLVGLVLWAWTTKNLKRVMLGGVVVGILFLLMYFTNFTYSGPETRGGVISATDLVGRVVAPVNPDLAADYTDDGQMYGGTVAWRALFWAEIWRSVHENPVRALLGYGYGFHLGELVPFDVGVTRTPHNTFFYVLGYAGWLGVLIFVAFQAELVRLLWIVYRKSGQPIGIVFWAAMMVFSSFTPFFEVPQGAIPFYVVVGCATVPLLHIKERKLMDREAQLGDGLRPA